MSSDGLSRRSFLKQTALAGAGVVTASWLTACNREPSARAVSLSPSAVSSDVAAATTRQTGASKVAVLRHSGVVKSDSLDADICFDMLDAGIRHITGINDVNQAWAKIAGPKDVVCIKLSCIAGALLSVHPILTGCVCRCLTDAGVKPENIILWERTTRELTNAGYTINRGGPGIQCYGTDGAYSGDVHYESYSGKLSSILTDKATVLINMPILKNHGGAGVTLAMKNHYGTINNPGNCHGNNCNPAIPHISMLEPIKSKTRLIVCDATRACYNGGPGARPQFMWNYNGILMAQDPVAHDTIGWQIITKKRQENGMGVPNVNWIATAAELGLGTNNVNQMSLLDRDLG